MITSDESLLTPWFFENTHSLHTGLLCNFLSCLSFLCTYNCRHDHDFNDSTILVMGNNGIVQCKLTFVQASCFINGISDSNSKIVWKTVILLQTCATREYDVIKMLVLTDVFPREPFESRFVYLLFSSSHLMLLQTGGRVIWRHFHSPIWDHI